MRIHEAAVGAGALLRVADLDRTSTVHMRYPDSG
jgi:hypothetical protein